MEFIVNLFKLLDIRKIFIAAQGFRFHILLKIDKPFPAAGLLIIESDYLTNKPTFARCYELRLNALNELFQKLTQIVTDGFELILRHIKT